MNYEALIGEFQFKARGWRTEAAKSKERGADVEAMALEMVAGTWQEAAASISNATRND